MSRFSEHGFTHLLLGSIPAQIYGVADESAHKAAGGLPVVRAAQTIISAPVDEVALCWWQAARRKV